jgi:ubiquitin-like protein Pup
MAEQERKQAKAREVEEDEAEIIDLPEGQGEAVTERIDDLLDEIDSVLEENAEEFVKNYVQKGGE